MTLIATSGIRKGCGTRFHCPRPGGAETTGHLTPNDGQEVSLAFNPPRISERTLAEAWRRSVCGNHPAVLVLYAHAFLDVDWKCDNGAL